MGIRRRILLSFLALFVVVFVAMTLLSTLLVARAVERRLEVQTDRLAQRLSANRGMLNDIVLDYIKEINGAESARVGPPGDPAQGDYVFRARLGPMEELIMTYKADIVLEEKRKAVLPLAGEERPSASPPGRCRPCTS